MLTKGLPGMMKAKRANWRKKSKKASKISKKSRKKRALARKA